MEKPRIIKSKWSFIPVAVLIFLVASEFIWYASYTSPKPTSLQIFYSNSANNNLDVSFRINSNFPSDVTVVAIPVLAEPKDLPVYVFYDENYTTQGIGSDWFLIHRLWEHLKINLSLRNYSAEVKLANAKELENIFKSNESAVVIMAYGAFPSNVFSWETNLVKPWIQSGGVLIWFGWEIGYYTVDIGQKSMNSDMPNQLHFEGIRRMGLEAVFQVTYGDPYWITTEDKSDLSKILDIRYNQIRTAPLLEKVLEVGGLALGKIGQVNSSTRISVSAIPMGKGRVVTFGYFLKNVAESNPLSYYSTARDISQILCSGVLQMSSTLRLWYHNYQLSAGETKVDNFTVPLNPNIKGLVLYGYNSMESTGLLFFRKYLTI